MVQQLLHTETERSVNMSDKKDTDNAPEKEAGKDRENPIRIEQRGDDVLYEPRDGGDRRGGGRGLNPGRRLVDHHRVRSAFI